MSASSRKQQKGTAGGYAGKLTPMLEQYLELKAQNPEALLLARMGDFYETFFEDAQLLAEVTGVTLTSRDSKSEHPVPLAGVPHHALDSYLAKCLGAGLTVAICEQVEDPALAKGLVKREIVEIVSPGTTTAPELLDQRSASYCLAWLPGKADSGWAIVDAATGEFRCGNEDTTLTAVCERHPVKEVVVAENTDAERLQGWRAALPAVVINPVNESWFHPAFARRTLLDHFRLANLTAFGLEDEARGPAATAAGALLRYLTSLNLGRPEQVASLDYRGAGDRLVLDEETLRNLEIFQTFRGDAGPGTLVHHIDDTVTPMGRRLLEQRLAEAATDLDELSLWHGGVDQALADRGWRDGARGLLARLGDLERLAARAVTGRIGPSAVRTLGAALAVVEELAATGTLDASPAPVRDWSGELPDVSDLARRILETIAEDAPATTRKPGTIAPGVDAELDRYRAVTADSKAFLADMQNREREATGIGSLKVGYNKVFGYYLEVTNRHLDKVPDHYEQKQTLVNGCRFHTPELKDAEATILEADEKADALEIRLFEQLVADVGARSEDLRRVAAIAARIDLLLAFAETAEKHDYCRPRCDDSLVTEIAGGRHPVVEQLLPGDFIANDTTLDGDQRQILLMTGPNMGGKSTYLRQVALITLMAQIGSFVPARSARLGVADRIFTRVGASDNLARGESTFYMEMSETAHILHRMSRRSLVILDEIGRGTSTYDGLSLAWAITEHLGDPHGPRPRSIFATHYHELTDLAGDLPGLVNLKLDVKEWEGRIIFLHAVSDGRSDKSYGIHVARLAGVPEAVLRRAEDVLASLSAGDERDRVARRPHATEASPPAPRAQLSLFGEQERDALDALRDLNLDTISPVDAFMWLARLKQSLED